MTEEVKTMKRRFQFTKAAVTMNLLVAVLAVSGVLAGRAAAAESQRARWNQNEAVRMVQEVINQEESKDFAWNKINWLSDTAEARAVADREQKPILVYFFLKGTSGPAAAPC
jgi:hypothetical protein